MRKLVFIITILIGVSAKAQKIEDIYFHLYTDSLKKGFHNYINVDGKLDNGRFVPLTDKDIVFSSNTGKWEGNDIIVDPAYTGDTVVISATLKKQPSLTKTVTIHIKKVLNSIPLKSEQEILNEMKKPAKRRQ